MRNYLKFFLRRLADQKYHILFFFIFSVFIFFALPVPGERLKGEGSFRIFSQEGNLLREFCSPEGNHSIWIEIDDFPKNL